MSKSCLYYTDSQLDEQIANKCRTQLRKAWDGKIVSVSLKPLDPSVDFADNQIVMDMERGYLTMFKQILAGLEASTADVIFMTEHDVLYPKEHFDFTPPEKDKFYYDLNWWKIGRGDLAVHWDAAQVSGLCAYRDLLIDFYRKRVTEFELKNFDRKFEPASGKEGLLETWKASRPHIDIRHKQNLTYNKWTLDHFRKKDTAVNFESRTISEIPGWSKTDIVI